MKTKGIYYVGTLNNKYLILECLSYAYHAETSAKLLHSVSHNLRILLYRNCEAFRNIMVDLEALNINYFGELLSKNLISGRPLKINI